MKLQTYTFLRNYNFLELIKNYNFSYDKFYSKDEISESEMKSIKSLLASSLIGVDERKNIPELIIDDKTDNSYNLYYQTSNGKYHLALNKISPVATKEEVLIINSMLQNGDFDLFIDDNIKKKLEININKYLNNINIEKTNLYDFIEDKGKSKSSDILADIKHYYIQLNNALELGLWVKFKYHFNNNIYDVTAMPTGFIYSQLEKKIKLKAVKADGKTYNYYIAFMDNLTIENTHKTSDFPIHNIEKKELIFSFKDENGRAERVSALFSDYNKIINNDKEKRIVTYKVYYNNTHTENKRITHRLLSIGKDIEIMTDEKYKVCNIAKKALEQYK